MLMENIVVSKKYIFIDTTTEQMIPIEKNVPQIFSEAVNEVLATVEKTNLFDESKFPIERRDEVKDMNTIYFIAGAEDGMLDFYDQSNITLGLQTEAFSSLPDMMLSVSQFNDVFDFVKLEDYDTLFDSLENPSIVIVINAAAIEAAEKGVLTKEDLKVLIFHELAHLFSADHDEIHKKAFRLLSNDPHAPEKDDQMLTTQEKYDAVNQAFTKLLPEFEKARRELEGMFL